MEKSVNVENLLEKYTTEQVLRAIRSFYQCLIDDKKCKGININQFDNMVPKAVVKDYQSAKTFETSDHPPCGDCGGTFFLRTGTCHVCQTCGASQGCS